MKHIYSTEEPPPGGGFSLKEKGRKSTALAALSCHPDGQPIGRPSPVFLPSWVNYTGYSVYILQVPILLKKTVQWALSNHREYIFKFQQNSHTIMVNIDLAFYLASSFLGHTVQQTLYIPLSSSCSPLYRCVFFFTLLGCILHQRNRMRQIADRFPKAVSRWQSGFPVE